ncbi:arylsulfatase A-like enzyme [Rhizomicrobium palustre]|uniref:Arylsulfatase A-like enzyme n=1 Tax=Rhizomicrobium palustre TaxID=189966 RepID=A0A846N5A5_9PROT|nr:alkaline phosphatase family protein [Rhizomicrobium palustre]NIK90190.1 arylsulfatase A-like enzyme [Rhizomicrobium palustre]
MSRLLATTALCLTLGAMALPAAAEDAAQSPAKRNVVIFVADGLRYTSVTPETAPTMYKLRKDGVDFANSHSTYPTLTTVNAAVIATGHYPGDTGNFGNSMWVAKPVPCRMGASVTFIEDDCILKDVKALYPNDYIAQKTLMETAREAGWNTVVIGKKGPAAIEYLGALESEGKDVGDAKGLFIDDATNRPQNLDGSPSKSTVLKGALAAEVMTVTGGLTAPPFSATPNLTQQAYLRAAATQSILPRLKDAGKPFAIFYWSRDPDTTQHGAMDSDGKLVPGINSTSGRAAISNADSDLKGLLETLKQYDLDKNTDVVVIADHGFSTISHAIPNEDGSVGRNTLAPGFVAMDVGGWLGKKVFDPDREGAEVDTSSGEHPAQGNGLIGDDPEKPEAVVVANGGSTFIYIPDHSPATAKKIYAELVKQPYVGGLFVDDAILSSDKPAFAGALALSQVNFIGSSKMPRPAIIIAFRNFVAKGCVEKLEQMCQAEIADTTLHTGQGMHGSFGRADTRNFMAAIGPDFKKAYVDTTPVGNVDVAPTLAHILGIDLKGPGALKGRVASEALQGGVVPKVVKTTVASDKAANGFQTLLNLQEVDGHRYFTAAGMPGRTVGLEAK